MKRPNLLIYCISSSVLLHGLLCLLRAPALQVEVGRALEVELKETGQSTRATPTPQPSKSGHEKISRDKIVRQRSSPHLLGLSRNLVPKFNFDVGDSHKAEGAGDTEGQNLSGLQTRIEADISLQEIYQKIDTHLELPDDLKAHLDDQEAVVAFTIDEDGQLLQILNASSSGDAQTEGLLVQTVSVGLGASRSQQVESQMDNSKSRGRVVKAHLRIVRVFPDSLDDHVGKLRIVGNHLNFIRIINGERVLQARNLAPADGLPENGINLNLIELYRRWFGKAPSSRRMEWDLKYREAEYRHACSTGRAEGACHELGELFRLRGQSDDAKKFYGLACSQGLTSDCAKIE